jgi:hypothetical protein
MSVLFATRSSFRPRRTLNVPAESHRPTFLDIHLTRMLKGKHTEPERYKVSLMRLLRYLCPNVLTRTHGPVHL